MNNPYSDQIWLQSQCRQFENNVKIKLSYQSRGLNSELLINLVDNVPRHLKSTKWIVTDNVLTRPHIPLWPEFWGSFSYDPVYVDRLPTKTFNCFINRTCATRQSWLYQFVRREIFDHGYISFLLDYRKMPPGVETKQELYEWIFNQYGSIFAKEHEQLRSLVPYQNFQDELEQVIVDTKIGLVIETYFDDPDIISFSEKVFRSLQLPRPFMLYASPGAVSVLRNQGFDLYDDVVDHSYDSILDPIQRQVAMLDQLQQAQSLVYNSAVLDNYQKRAAHNQRLLKDLKAQWPNKLQLTLEKISTLKAESLP